MLDIGEWSICGGDRLERLDIGEWSICGGDRLELYHISLLLAIFN